MTPQVILIWQEIPEITKIFTINPEDQAEYELLKSFHNRYINIAGDHTDDIYTYFYDAEHNFKFLPEEEIETVLEIKAIDMGISGEIAVVCTGIYL